MPFDDFAIQEAGHVAHEYRLGQPSRNTCHVLTTSYMRSTHIRLFYHVAVVIVIKALDLE